MKDSGVKNQVKISAMWLSYRGARSLKYYFSLINQTSNSFLGYLVSQINTFISFHFIGLLQKSFKHSKVTSKHEIEIFNLPILTGKPVGNFIEINSFNFSKCFEGAMTSRTLSNLRKKFAMLT